MMPQIASRCFLRRAMPRLLRELLARANWPAPMPIESHEAACRKDRQMDPGRKAGRVIW